MEDSTLQVDYNNNDNLRVSIFPTEVINILYATGYKTME